ncbi:sensor histidine kinase [Paraliobacillus sediminis]|uniref:sensor histidine kinase n=1 Tax=Paraliobacillus sediminis TaxID=1885916 RepID=UPI0013C2DE05|nr:HAMP domain-containing sensor histidine kinase [Paraliobacillus sediminis]
MEKLKRYGTWVINFILNKRRKKPSLLYYWTKRYLVTLVIGLVIIGLVSIFWIRHNTIENRLELTKLLAQELADRAVDETSGEEITLSHLPFILEERENLLNNQVPLQVYIKTNDGELISPNPIINRFENRTEEMDWLETVEISDQLVVEKIPFEANSTSYAVISPIVDDEKNIGAVIIIQRMGSIASINKEEYQLLAMLLVSMAILGWLVIYFLSKKLAKPVQEVAVAAEKLRNGDYTIHLNENIQEKELHQLVISFKEMAINLQQLEGIRSELLAGVTHELKTPITSVSALIQAVQGDVVDEESKNEFLQMALKEAGRLQNMVEDLLDFNSFTAGSIIVNSENLDIKQTLKEIIYQWEIVHAKQLIGKKLIYNLSEEQLYAIADPIRLQQIITNLLNNGLHAIKGNVDGHLIVEVYQQKEIISIEVKDNGTGIPKEEQPFIFERFYRGEDKKHVEHGLGLGLPYSLLLAKAQAGDLFLKKSVNGETVFVMHIPPK